MVFEHITWYPNFQGTKHVQKVMQERERGQDEEGERWRGGERKKAGSTCLFYAWSTYNNIYVSCAFLVAIQHVVDCYQGNCHTFLVDVSLWWAMYSTYTNLIVSNNKMSVITGPQWKACVGQACAGNVNDARPWTVTSMGPRHAYPCAGNMQKSASLEMSLFARSLHSNANSFLQEGLHSNANSLVASKFAQTKRRGARDIKNRGMVSTDPMLVY